MITYSYIDQIVALFIIWKIEILFFALAASCFLSVECFIPQKQGFLANVYYPDAPYLQWVWANSDGGHYLDIATKGYNAYNTPFFPLLPYLMNLVHKILSVSNLQAGLLVSNLSLFLSLFVVYKIIALDYSKKTALRTLFFLLIFPVSFFYGSIYTESIYFLGATLSFYFARKSNWLLSGAFGLLAGLSRLVGIALLPALLVEWYYQNKQSLRSYELKQSLRSNELEMRRNILKRFIKEKAFFVFLVPFGLILYSIFLQFKFGDFLIFQKAMATWGQENIVFPLQTIWRYLKLFYFVPKDTFTYWISVLEFISTIFYFALSFFVLKKIRFSYGVFMLISLIIPVLTGTFQSMPRYILHLFPAFLAIAVLTEKTKGLTWLLAIIFTILGFVLVAFFTRGYFVA